LNFQKASYLFLVLILVSTFSSCQQNDEINITNLLNEIVDRDKITQFPDPYYQSLQASSYNRASVSKDAPGWFADSDGEYFVRSEEINGKKEWVLMEDDGPGAITKIWAVCFYYGLDNTTGANINIYLDGNTTPIISTNFFNLVKGEDFVKAPFADYSTRVGNLYLPIPYAKSCKITMDQKAFYNIINYRKYAQDTKVKTFTKGDFKQALTTRTKVAKALSSYKEAKGTKDKKETILKPGTTLDFKLPEGNNAIREFQIKFLDTTNIAQKLRSTIIQANFDGEKTIWAPIGDFFNNVGKTHSYNMWERTVTTDGTMICRWVMPYENNGEIGIKNLGKENVNLEMTVITDQKDWISNSMHFYATWQMDAPTPTFPLYGFNFLSATGKGVVIGDQWSVLNPVQGWWGEGDEKIYIDDDIEKKFPSHFGTGTEDYYGWAGGKIPTPADEFSKPFLGNIIVGDKSKGYNVCTRTRVLDAIPFKEKIQFDIESSCGRRSKSHFLQYAQTTFWYGIPGVKHNKPALPEYAALKLPTVADLEKVIAKAKESQYSVDGALEAELLPIIKKSKDVVADFAKIPMWGEISAGALNNMWFEHAGDFAELKITEQFEKATIKLCTAIGSDCGNFDIYVNDIKIKEQDFYGKHEGIINPYLDLGESEPINNAFIIRFAYKGNHPKARHTKINTLLV